MITRYNPLTHESMPLISHTSFTRLDGSDHWEDVPSISFEGGIREIRHEQWRTHGGGGRGGLGPPWKKNLPWGSTAGKRNMMQIFENSITAPLEKCLRTPLVTNHR